MTKKITKRTYKLMELTEKKFPLYIKEYDEVDHVMHAHDFIELVIVEDGKGTHCTESSKHMIVAGDVLVILKGSKHGYENTTNLSITNIIFDMSLLDSLPETFKHIPGFYSLFLLTPFQQKRTITQKGFLTLQPDEIAHVKQLTGRIIREQQEKHIGYETVCVLVLVDLIIFLSRLNSKHNLIVHTKKLSEVLSYIEKNYASNITLEQLSHVAKLSPRNFQQIFKDYMGLSPFSYLIKTRLQYAKKLLKETESTISEIAYVTGFGDSAYFTRQFKKIFRTPPSRYRKQVKIN